MNSLEFKIFIPNRKRNVLTPNTIVYSLFFATVTIFMVAALIRQHPEYILFLFLIPLIFSIYFFISKFWKHKPLDGDLFDSLIINSNYIKITDQFFQLEEIKKINLQFINYYGEKEDYRYNYNPILSQGTSNHISVVLKNGQTIKTYFKLNFKDHYKTFFPFITKMIKLNKISFLRGIELLEINDYHKIQEFKKELFIHKSN